MDLFREILINALMVGDIQVTFNGTGSTVVEAIEGKCYQALKKIKAVIDDDSLGDPECFQKIEEIICILEDTGSTGGSRHDFG